MKLLQKIRMKSGEPAAAPPVKLAFLGDSVTHGFFEILEKEDGRFDCVYDHAAVYHARLKRKMETVFPNCPVCVINAGISGGDAVQGAERVRRDVIDAGPDLAVVCFGLNDALAGEKGLDRYGDALASIFRQLRAAEIDTVFLTPNMMCTARSPELAAGWLRDTAERCAEVQNGGEMDRYMQRARETAEREGALLCDCYADWKRLYSLGADVTYLLANRINHPAREMHALFAEKLFRTVFLRENDTK